MVENTRHELELYAINILRQSISNQLDVVAKKGRVVLTDHLAKLRNSEFEARLPVASSLLSQLKEEDIYALIGWDVFSMVYISGSTLDLSQLPFVKVIDKLGEVLLHAKIGKIARGDPYAHLITYTDTDYCVFVSKSIHPVIPEGSVHTIASLLMAMYLINDHVDDVLLLPYELRQSMLSEFARNSTLSKDTFINLALTFPHIQQSL